MYPPIWGFALAALLLEEPERSAALKLVPWTVLDSIRIRAVLAARTP